jgi:hypothetical protein
MITVPTQTKNSPKSCSAFSAAERTDPDAAQNPLTQIYAVGPPTIFTLAIWTSDRRAHWEDHFNQLLKPPKNMPMRT